MWLRALDDVRPFRATTPAQQAGAAAAAALALPVGAPAAFAAALGAQGAGEDSAGADGDAAGAASRAFGKAVWEASDVWLRPVFGDAREQTPRAPRATN